MTNTFNIFSGLIHIFMEDGDFHPQFLPKNQRNIVYSKPDKVVALKKKVAVSEIPEIERKQIYDVYTGQKPKSVRNITPSFYESWSHKEDTSQNYTTQTIENFPPSYADYDETLERPSRKKKQIDDRKPLEKPANEWTTRDCRLWRADNEISVTAKHRDSTSPILHWSPYLPEELAVALKLNDYHEPMPVQAQCIPISLAGRDIIGLSQPGTGKTLAYSIPIIVTVMKFLECNEFLPNEGPIGVIMVPTHELADQVNSVISGICQHLNIKSSAITGAVSLTDQTIDLMRGFHIIVATPGRLVNLLEGHLIVLNQCKFVVLDEADKMMDKSFGPDIENILSMTSTKDRRLLMFSATMPDAILTIVEQFFSNEVKIRVGKLGEVSENITQVLYYVKRTEKRRVVIEHIHGMKAPIIVFTNTIESCESFGRTLDEAGFRVASIHGGKPQKEREDVMDAISEGIVDIICATDILSRGIDIEGIKNVVNYEVPNDMGTYLHRIGRTGRAGEKGTATTFLTPDDTSIMYSLCQMFKRNNWAIPQDLLNNPASQQRDPQV